MNQSAEYGASDASSSYGDEAGLSFDNLDMFLDNLPSSPLTMDGGVFPSPHFGVVPHTVQPPSGMFVVTISELRPHTDLYVSRLPYEPHRGAILLDG